MKKTVIYGIAVALALSFGADLTRAQKVRENRPIDGRDNDTNDTKTLPPTIQRIKSLKLPAGFSAAKFAEIANPRILAVSCGGTDQRKPDGRAKK